MTTPKYYRGGILADTPGYGRAIESGEGVITLDGRKGTVADRIGRFGLGDNYTLYYLVLIDGQCVRCKTNELVPVVNP